MKINRTIKSKFQDKLSSLLKTAENLKVKGLAEVTILHHGHHHGHHHPHHRQHDHDNDRHDDHADIR